METWKSGGCGLPPAPRAPCRRPAGFRAGLGRCRPAGFLRLQQAPCLYLGESSKPQEKQSTYQSWEGAQGGLKSGTGSRAQRELARATVRTVGSEERGSAEFEFALLHARGRCGQALSPDSWGSRTCLAEGGVTWEIHSRKSAWYRIPHRKRSISPARSFVLAPKLFPISGLGLGWIRGFQHGKGPSLRSQGTQGQQTRLLSTPGCAKLR